jgi:ADP-ribosylglycohydrolase
MLSYTDAACVAIALALCLNVLSDTDTACVATALAGCLKKEKKIRR